MRDQVLSRTAIRGISLGSRYADGMHDSASTCWTMISSAAAGDAEQRTAFVRRYGPAIRAYLAARWRGSPLAQEVEDAVQVVFLECIKDGGVLSRAEDRRGAAEAAHSGGFRAYLYGTARNIALRFETEAARRGRERSGHAGLSASASKAPIGPWPQTTPGMPGRPHAAPGPPDPSQWPAGVPDRPHDEAALSVLFDRAWAARVMKDAAVRQSERAAESGEAAIRRVELLRLRFQEGLPIRAIAERWQEDPAKLHHEYAKARAEFKRALLEVISFDHPKDGDAAEAECSQLLALLG